MSFFMTENLGPIIQVFSRDLTVVTEDLIDSFHYAVIYSFITVAIVIRTAQDQPLFFVIGIPLLMVAAFILRLYSSKLKIIKTELKTANDELFHAIADSIEGVKVLRTAEGTGWAIDLLREAFRNARIAIVASENCNIWLMQRLDPISTLLAFLTLIMVTQMDTKLFPLLSEPLQKVYIQQTLSYLVFIQWSLKAIGLFVYNLGSVERIHQYIKDIPREPSGTADLDKMWPESGDIEFKDICLKYAPNLPLALDGVSFKLKHGAKVGVVGRTGSGKSTLLVSLFRLIQPCDGDMTVGGTKITDVNVISMRRQLSIVPQVTLLYTCLSLCFLWYLVDAITCTGAHHVLWYTQGKRGPFMPFHR
jgi:ATP-binding cassette subfamily C (CFTR/MRP) protein 1